MDNLANLIDETGAQVYSGNRMVQDLYRTKEELKHQSDTNKLIEGVLLLFQQFDEEEKAEWLCRTKLSGNRYFRNGHMDKAEQFYMEALIGAGMMNDIDAKVTILCNLAACKMYKKEYKAAQTLATQAIEINPQSARAYDRRIAANFELANTHQILRDIEEGLKFCDDEVIYRKLLQYKSRYSREYEKDKKMYGEMFKNRYIQNDDQDDDDEGTLTYIIIWIFKIPLNIYRGITNSLCKRRA